MRKVFFAHMMFLLCFVSFGVHAKTLSESQGDCMGGDGEACMIAGDAFKYGESVGQDYSQAAIHYKLGCDVGHGQSCSRLSGLYAAGDGVRQNSDESWRLTRLACELDHLFSCNVLGTTYERGFPRTSNSYDPPDYQQAREYYSYACDRNFGSSCVNLAAMHAYGVGVPRNVEEGRRLYKKACDLGSTSGCRGLERLN